ncbi:MAG: response regulator [Planctomycetes bacterium]|nr:response regulator [Planctomycetota bacterium]
MIDYPNTPRVLLVEDDEDIRDFLSNLLESYGCETALAASRQEVETVLEDSPIDLVLLDIMLPNLDGRDLAGEFRERGFTFPIYFMTGMRSLIGADDLENVNGILYKPFTLVELRNLIDRNLINTVKTNGSRKKQRILELMTAVATQREAMRRQKERLEKLVAADKGSSPEQNLTTLSELSIQHGENLEILSNLLKEMEELLQQQQED